MNEPTFIAALRTHANHPAARGFADDAAVLEVGGAALVLTQDAMAEGVHWPAGLTPQYVAHRLIASNLSDLAAKGARPVGCLLSYTLGDDAFDRAFAEAIGALCARYAMPLLGGDTIALPGAAPSPVHSLTAIGEATHWPIPSRSGAKPGDAVYLIGTLGAAMAAFEAEDFASDNAFTAPEPLLTEGQALAPHATAMMDVSDGLLLDATRLAEASGVTLALDRDAPPIAVDEARRMDALGWGDDYALLLTAPADAALPVSVTRIGTVRSPGAHPVLLDGAPPPPGTRLGYRHGDAYRPERG